MTTQSIREYATAHGLDPADLAAVLLSDADLAPAAYATGNDITGADGVYSDGIYPVAVLDLAAAGIVEA